MGIYIGGEEVGTIISDIIPPNTTYVDNKAVAGEDLVAGDRIWQSGNSVTIKSTEDGLSGSYLSLSPNNKTLAVCNNTSSSKPYLKLYNVEDMDNITEIENPTIMPTSYTYACSWSPDSRYLAIAGGANDKIIVYDTQTIPYQKIEMPEETDYISGERFDVKFSPNGKLLIVSRWTSSHPYLKNSLFIYDTTTTPFTKLLNPTNLPTDNDGISAISFSDDGTKLAIPGYDQKTLYVYEVNNTTLTLFGSKRFGSNDNLTGCAFKHSSNTEIVVSNTSYSKEYGYLFLLDVSTPNFVKIKDFKYSGYYAYYPTWSFDNKILTCSNGDGNRVVIDANNNKVVCVGSYAQSTIIPSVARSNASFSNDNKYLWLIGQYGTVAYNVENLLKVFKYSSGNDWKQQLLGIAGENIQAGQSGKVYYLFNGPSPRI